MAVTIRNLYLSKEKNQKLIEIQNKLNMNLYQAIYHCIDVAYEIIVRGVVNILEIEEKMEEIKKENEALKSQLEKKENEIKELINERLNKMIPEITEKVILATKKKITTLINEFNKQQNVDENIKQVVTNFYLELSRKLNPDEIKIW